MATIQEILDKINASKSNNVNNNSFIDLMRQISGNPEDAIAPVNDTNSIYGHIVQMYTTLYDSGVDYAILADEVDMLQGVYDNLIAINSVYADKTKLDSIYADKLTLDSLYADKDKLDQLFADKAIIDRVYGSIDNIDRVHTSIDKLDAVYADILNIDTVSNNLANIDIVAESDDNITIVADNVTDVNTVADNMIILNEIYNNRVEIYAADDNAVIATTKAAEASVSATAGASSASAAAASASTSTTKASEASASAATALGYKNDVSTMKLAIETIYDTFDDRFLGTKTVDPTVDNDGNALTDGAMYFNTSSNTMKVYDVGTITWYSIPQIYLSALLDVNLTSITSGNVLRWNGTKWINYTLTKADVGLGSVDNTADSTKNVLSATTLTTARTINGVSFNGSANITTYDSTKVAKVSSTDNAIVRFNGTNGEVKNSGVTINDANEIIGATNLGTAASKNVGLDSGNVMQVGAFGTGATFTTTILDANVAANSVNNKTGFYPYMSNAGSTNMPYDYAYLYQFFYHNGNCTQIAYGYNTNMIWIRYRYENVWTSWSSFLNSSTTTIDANGFIKSASPVLNLYTDRIAVPNEDEFKVYPVMERLEKGVYEIRNTLGLRLDDGWYIETPNDRNGNKYFNVEWFQNIEPTNINGVVEEYRDDIVLTVKVYTRVWNKDTGLFDNGVLVDVNADQTRYISLRFNELKPELPVEELTSVEEL